MSQNNEISSLVMQVFIQVETLKQITLKHQNRIYHLHHWFSKSAYVRIGFILLKGARLIFEKFFHYFKWWKQIIGNVDICFDLNTQLHKNHHGVMWGNVSFSSCRETAGDSFLKMVLFVRPRWNSFRSLRFLLTLSRTA